MEKQKGKPGRSKGSCKYDELTITVRIPLRLIKKVEALLTDEIKEYSATASNEKGRSRNGSKD